jgi:uncharacterized protein YndB with AHSA1/START domain
MSGNLAGEQLLITRTFDAPASLMFALWSTPEHFVRWMGPAGFSCSQCEIDFRVGGRYRAMITSPESGDSPFSGVYREIEPHTHLVFTFAWHNTGPSAGIDTLITITFREHGGKTVQTFHQAPFIDLAARDRHVGGWSSTFDKAAAYAASITHTKGPIMKKYMAVFTGSAASRAKSGWDTMDDATRRAREAEGMAAWHKWHADHAAILVDGGGPLGKTKRTGAGGVSDISNNIAGYVIVQADSHDAAAQLFLNHPHFAIFPGDAVEIMECLPIPGQ